MTRTGDWDQGFIQGSLGTLGPAGPEPTEFRVEGRWDCQSKTPPRTSRQAARTSPCRRRQALAMHLNYSGLSSRHLLYSGSMPFDPEPEVELVSALQNPYNTVIAAARTCYSSRVVTPGDVDKDEK